MQDNYGIYDTNFETFARASDARQVLQPHRLSFHISCRRDEWVYGHFLSIHLIRLIRPMKEEEKREIQKLGRVPWKNATTS